MRPIAYISASGNLYYDKSSAGGNAIALIPIPIPLTNARVITAMRSIGRKPQEEDIDWTLIRAIERAHGIFEPEDMK